MDIGYHWREISDLPDHLDPWRDRELESLFQVWIDQRSTLETDESLLRFNLQLTREWAVETGIIENVYTLDRGVTQTLIERGIDAAYIPHDTTDRDPELVARIIQSHAEVLEGLFAFVKGERPLTVGHIKELHAALLRYQTHGVVFDQFDRPFEKELEKGRYKTMPNNPRTTDGSVHEYCPPEHVASEMDRLITLHDEHDRKGVRPEVEAAWLHHAFTQIHPFQDGNGRVARALASLVFIKARFFPLVVTRDDREKYIDALAAADAGSLQTLIALFAQLQKRALTRAIVRAVDVKPPKTVDEAVEATRDLLVNLGTIVREEWRAVSRCAQSLCDRAMERLENVADSLRTVVWRVDNSFQFDVALLSAAPQRELGEVAKQLRYDPNLAVYDRSIAMNLRSKNVAGRMVVSFHGIGSSFRGLLVAAAYFQIDGKEPTALTEDVFRISYEEPCAEIAIRFDPWLDQCIINGLALWRRAVA